MARKKKETTQPSAEEVLQSWRSVVRLLSSLNEKQSWEYLQIELRDKARRDVIERLYSRFNHLRRQRELQELLKWNQ